MTRFCLFCFTRIFGLSGYDAHGRMNAMLPFLRRLISSVLLLVFLSLTEPSTAASDRQWSVFDIGGVDYIRYADLCQYYRFKKIKGKPGFETYGAGNRVISVRPQRQDFYVNDYHYVLSYPVTLRQGELMISTTDVRKLVDPVLRPRFSTANANITTVIVDAGHGGHDAGARGYAIEKECNLAVALKLRDKLTRRGFKVVMTRDGDYFLTLAQRVALANRYPNSLFVSIHHNSGGSRASGIETFTLAPHGTTSPFARTRRTEDLAGNNQDSENILLATAVHSRAIKSTKAIDRGIQRARFSVLCTIKRPAILFEGGFVSHREEGAKITSDSYRETLANCICEGIVAYCAEAKRRHGTGSNLKTRGLSGEIKGSSAASGTGRRPLKSKYVYPQVH